MPAGAVLIKEIEHNVFEEKVKTDVEFEQVRARLNIFIHVLSRDDDNPSRVN